MREASVPQEELGSEFYYTPQQAANRLGVTTRTLRNYQARGLVERIVRDDKPYYLRTTIDEMAEDMGVGGPTIDKKLIRRLVSRVRKLEEGMAVCKKAMGIQDNPLRFSEEEAVMLHMAAEGALATGDWLIPEMQQWEKILSRMDEESFAAMGKALGHKAPWVVFWKLCLGMHAYAGAHPQFKTTLELQTVHRDLGQAKRFLRSALLLWIELGMGTTPRDVLEHLTSEKDRLMERLSKS
jgi:hypothetical protein